MPVYRGRLIDPLIAVIERLDTSATRAASGYDDDFNTLCLDGSTGKRRDPTRYLTPIELPAQVEDNTFEERRQAPTGDNPRSLYTLIFHFGTLEGLGLVDPNTGNALLHKGDRLVQVKDDVGTVVMTPRAGFELYCTEVRPGGGWLSKRRNLLIADYDARPKALV